VDTSGGPLGVRYSLRYVPSLATLAALADSSGRAAALAAGSAVVVGNPVMPRVRSPGGGESTLGPLAGAEAEARWVADRVGVAPLHGAAATEAEIKRRLPSASLVHLATHGYAYSTAAEARESFVALGPTPGEDGLLTVGEVLDDIPPLRAELVVLSACQTGLGDLKQAEGTVGLQRAFLAKGARSVLVSLWSVSDHATDQLMRRFYTHWRSGASKADALRRAQADVRGAPGSVFHHPRYWAPFILVGASR
jgi:CHAT domain-containing protein